MTCFEMKVKAQRKDQQISTYILRFTNYDDFLSRYSCNSSILESRDSKDTLVTHVIFCLIFIVQRSSRVFLELMLRQIAWITLASIKQGIAIKS